MKTFRQHSKLIVLILCVPFLTQCFSIYHSANVSLHEAAQSNSSVKITNTNGKKKEFSRIELADDGKFYAINFNRPKAKFDRSKTAFQKEAYLIDMNTLRKVQVKDRLTSTIVNIASPFVIMGIIIGPYMIRTGGFPIY